VCVCEVNFVFFNPLTATLRV